MTPTRRSLSPKIPLAGSSAKAHWRIGAVLQPLQPATTAIPLLVSGFEPSAHSRPPAISALAKDVLFFSDLHYNFRQNAIFGEATYNYRQARGDQAACAATTSRRAATNVTASSPIPARRTARPDAQVSVPRSMLSYSSTTPHASCPDLERLPPGRHNDPLNVPSFTPHE